MKKKYFIGAAILVACIVIFGICISLFVPKSLADMYPAFVNGEYQGIQMYAGNENISVEITDEELQDIFGNGRVKKSSEFTKTPEYAFELYIKDGQSGYLIVVGYDQTLAVAQIDDLEGSRTFWTDIDGEIFSKLYTCYRNNGGEEIPAISEMK